MIARAALATSALLATLACTPESIDPMKRQPRFERYGKSTLFPDGRMMRTPPEGTVPRERGVGSRELMTGLDLAGAPVKSIPIALNRELLDQGRHNFEIFCAACHGLVGDGDSIVARNMNLRAPPNLLIAPYSTRPVGHYYRVINEGFGLMAPYSAELNVRERWGVVAYLRALQLSQSATVKDVPADQRASLDRHPAGGGRQATPEPPNRATPGAEPVEKKELP